MKDRIKKLKKLKELKELELELICAEIDKLTKDYHKNKEYKEYKKDNIVEEKIATSTLEEQNTHVEKEHMKKVEEVTRVNKYAEDLVYEIKDYPRYLKNGKNQIFHETGIEIPQFEKNGKMHVKIFDRSNVQVEVEVDKL